MNTKPTIAAKQITQSWVIRTAVSYRPANRFLQCISCLLVFCATSFAQAGPPPPIAGGFTLVVIPDSQNYVWKRPELYTLQSGWIAANIHRYAIAHVLHVGDITQHNTREEWEAARRAHRVLEDLVPVAYASGNHDIGANGESDSRRSLFTEFVPLAEYRRQGGFGGVYDREPDRSENSWHLLNAGSRKWMILALEFAPRNDVLRWANEVVAQHPDRSVILLTHAYLYSDGTRYDWKAKGTEQPHNPHGYGVYKSSEGANDGEDVWRKLVSQHANFALVVCGHIGISAHLVSTGVHGNTVHQVVVDYQNLENGGNGWLRLLQFLPDGRTVRVRDYSPLLDQTSLAPECTFEFTLAPPPATRVARTWNHRPSAVFAAVDLRIDLRSIDLREWCAKCHSTKLSASSVVPGTQRVHHVRGASRWVFV